MGGPRASAEKKNLSPAQPKIACTFASAEPPSMNYLSVENISKSFGARTLFKELSFGLSEGDKTALIARNGTGKTTLLNLLAGREAPDTGRISYRKGLKVEFLRQEPELEEELRVLQAVLQADNPLTAAIERYERALQNMEDAEGYQKAFEAMERQNAWDFENQVRQILSKLGFEQTDQKIKQLSGGQKKRVSLAKVLISAPDLLILDEPTNHLDLDMIEWLEEYLKQKHITLLMVTHDRYFLESVCDSILELQGEKLFHHPGNYSQFLERKAEREEVESTNVGKAQNLMRKELQWIRRQPKARGTKSKARVENFQKIKAEASQDLSEQEMDMRIKMTRLGSKILELHNVKKQFGDQMILDGFSHTFKPGEKVGIVGPNGVGKSTFLQMITGEEPVDGGKIIWGETIRFGFYQQAGMQFKTDQRVIDVVKDIADYIPLEGKGGDLTAAGLLERFLFEGDQQYSRVAKLSGGEKRRLYLLTILMANPNFLILDEPTNDLDLLTLNVLEDFLQSFKGCVIVVTHDRFFMDKLTDHLFVFEGEGKVRDFPGNYSDYREAMAAEEETARLREKSIAQKKTKKADIAKAPEKKSQLTYAERLEMEELEKSLEVLEKRKAAIAHRFESAHSNAEELEKLSREMNQLNQELEDKEMRWLTLSEYA